MIKFNSNEWRLFRRLQRKHKVSTEFLQYNLPKIKKIIWYETWPRIIIKRYAIRKRNRIFLSYYRLRRVLFDQSNRKIVKRMKQNIRLWSKRIVAYKKRTQEVREYVEETVCEDKNVNSAEDVSTQMKEQLKLLKSGRRQQTLISASSTTCEQNKNDVESASKNIIHANLKKSDQKVNNVRNKLQDILEKNTAPETIAGSSNGSTPEASTSLCYDWQDNLESTPEKQATIQENVQPIKQLATDEKTEKCQYDDDLSASCKNPEKTIKTGINFLDMLMSKVNNAKAQSQTAMKTTEAKIFKTPSLTDVYHQHEHSLDSTDEFLGFEDAERVPGMLMTPIVPNSTRNNKNSVFVSETLNEYMRENDLETNYNIDEDKSITRMHVVHTDLEGLMTPKTQPPQFDMPAVPDNLLRFRTVAERRSYLQKFSKSHRLSIINNEASIYRELQKRIRYQKCKPSCQQVSAQSANSSMSFSRNGWFAASFINTEFNKYYYQMLNVDCGKYQVKLKGVRGNNEEFRKKPYISKVKNHSKACPRQCIDEEMWHDFKAIKTVSPRSKKLNKGSLPSVFKPCPLSHKTFQKPLDDDAAALLLAGGSMAVVRMPTIELEVFPECGRPLNEIAKRYLQYILPHHDISREWAEFSVSTLKLPGSLKDAVQAASDSIPQKTFTFVIPYLNDRNHVLVRRVVDRSEKLDQSFEHSLDSELVPKTDFTFRQNLDQSDDILLDCADVVSDMINTVAISCSENSFIKNDPDMLSGESECLPKSPTAVKNDKLVRPPSAASNSESKKQSKQKRVLSELKRLNATIIDAAVKPEKDKKPCSKEYCAMGCICSSLAEETQREHCGKTKCMWECSCKSSNQSRIMRLETDGRTITTEDAFILRRKATARLARMEKEFTSTVVLTENETLLINETNNDKKRRCTKVPKRYEYDDDTDDDSRKPSPTKTALTTIDNEKNLAVEVKEFREPVYVKDSVLEQLKHCTVNLVRLENMSNVTPWCMIHNLYKCFCKGRSLEGKPMIIEKDENNTTIEHGEDEQQWEMDYKINTKARYTFEKVEKKKYKDADDSDDDINAKYESRTLKKTEQDENTQSEQDNDMKSTNDTAELLVERNSLLEISKSDAEKPKRSLEDVRERFFASRPDECCRRQIPIPRRMFLYCNRKRRLNVLKYIKDNETEKTRLLLNEHVMRSVYYHKKDNENTTQKAEERRTSLCKEKGNGKEESMGKETLIVSCSMKKSEMPITPKPIDKGETKPTIHEIVNLLDDEEEIAKSSTNQESNINTNTSEPHSVHSTNDCPDNSNIGGVITMKKFGTLSGINVGNCNSSTLSNSSSGGESMFPKISNCFSLNAKANTAKPLNSPADEQKLQQHLADLTSATSVNSPAFATNSLNPSEILSKSNNEIATVDSLPPNVDNESVRDIYNSVIRTMNSLVSKKMQDVDFALKRESHIIPAPNADILCIMKWSNFLDAFAQGFAFIWQVRSNEGTYMVATIRNMMPMICEAMGVVNITALKPERLPLMARMLVHNVRNEHTTKLAVVMQGKLSYWVVKGFLKADPSMACNKPTPETHPSLTKKINILCTSLVKQRQKEEKKRELLAPKRPPTANNLTKVAKILATPSSVQPLVDRPIIPRTLPAPTIQRAVPSTVQSPLQKTLPMQGPLATPPPMQNPLPAPLPQPIRNVLPTQPPPPYQGQHQPISQQNSVPITSSSSSVPATPLNSSQTTLNNSQNPRKRKSVGDSPSNGIIPTKMDSYAKMSTNIEFRKVSPDDINEIHLPEIHKRNHKWLVLDLHNDFSHIFVPDFRDLVSLDRIQKVINFAKQKNKIVKLQFFQNAPFDAFVTPRSGKKIYFGPLNMDMKPPTLILLQSVDGQMMLRELYQLKHNIQKPLEEKTKAFWLLQMNGQTHFEVDTAKDKGLDSIAPNVAITPAVKDLTQPNTRNVEEDDDEDCMIIDEVSTDIQKEKTLQQNQKQQKQHQLQQQNEERYNFTIGSMSHDSSITITPQTNSLPGPPPIQTLVNTATSFNGEATPLLKIPNTNTIIKPLHQTQLPLPVVTLQHSAVITGITQAPQDASYGSTIFISSSTANSQNTISTTPALKQPSTLSVASSDVIAPIKRNDSSQCQASVQKRRRVSVVCHNPAYDRTSQNIAVNAVINKILPENIQDIQVNQPVGLLSTVSTIGSTTITKISDSSADKQCSRQEQLNSSKPLVFDVSFVDGGDEPAASIVIKPTASPTKTPVSAVACTSTITTSSVMSNSNSSVRGETPKVCLKNARNIPYKVVKIPSSTPAPTMTTTTVGQTNILNRLLHNKANTTVTSAVASSSTVTGGGTQPHSLMTKKVLNTTNPIKITSITSIPALKTPTKLITNAPIRITPKQTVASQPAESVKPTTSPTPNRSVSITPVVATSKPAPVVSLPNKVTNAVPLKTTYKPILPKSTSLTPVSSATITTSPRLPVASCSTSTSTATGTKTSNSTLAITSVQSFGSPLPQRNNSNDGVGGGGLHFPSHIQYGYIISAVYTDYKFVAKRVMDEFYVKVPSVGILKLLGLPAVNNYLNKHITKISETHTQSGDWKFVAASKAVQMQNHQKSLLVRKTKPSPSRSTQLNTSRSDSKKSQKVVNVTSISEPILIDD